MYYNDLYPTRGWTAAAAEDDDRLITFILMYMHCHMYIIYVYKMRPIGVVA
jgi:hypothetical protein